MFSKQPRTVRPVWGLAALLTIALAPAASHAQGIVFRNDTGMTLNVYVTSAPRGVVLRAPPVQLVSRMSSAPIRLPGNKVVIIQDARFPGRAIFQGTVPASDDTLY